MSNTTRQTSFRFPLWGKLGLVLALVFLVPTITGAALFFTTTQTIDRENIAAYVQQNGQRQRQVITSVFVRASESLEDFAERRETNQSLVGLLLADVASNPNLPVASASEVEQLLLETLLNPATTLFRDVRILDQRGTLVASAGDLLPGAAVIGQDESSSTAFQQITAELANDPTLTQTVSVSRFAGGTLELINAITLRETDIIIGYVVASLDVQGVLLPTLQFTDDVYPAYSFLLSENGVMLAPDDFTEQAEASRDSTAVDLAFQDQTGFDYYRIEGGTGDEIGGYFARIQGTPFVLLTQMNIADYLAQRQQYFTAVLFPVLVGVVVLGAVLVIFSRHLTKPLENLQRSMQALSVGSFDFPVQAVDRSDEIGDVARSFVDMRQQTRNLIEDLERRIARRTRDMETTQEISNFATTQRNLQVLMDDVVELIVERFDNIYHAQIFMVDNDQRFAVLRASTGAVGRELLSRGHRLAVGSISVIGQVTAQGEVMIARDTADSEVHRKNEFLPETRAELALPLKLDEEVIGALDVQSKEGSTFDQEQIAVLQSMAAQLAIAIENTRLYQESLQRLRSVQEQNRAETSRIWQEYMYDRRSSRMVHQAGTPTDLGFEDLRQRALEEQRPVLGATTERDTVPIAVPIRLRGEIIGAIAWELPSKTYDSSKLQLAEDLAERLSLSLENTRLFEQSQRATERERLVNEISAKLTGQTDVNRILQTAVREVGQALSAPQVSIRLSRRDDTGNFDSPATGAGNASSSSSENGN